MLKVSMCVNRVGKSPKSKSPYLAKMIAGEKVWANSKKFTGTKRIFILEVDEGDVIQFRGYVHDRNEPLGAGHISIQRLKGGTFWAIVSGGKLIGIDRQTAIDRSRARLDGPAGEATALLTPSATILLPDFIKIFAGKALEHDDAEDAEVTYVS